jgi:hypothetical protein
MTTPPRTPTTAAGRALLDDIAALTESGKRPYLPVDGDAILAIEAEARAPLDVERLARALLVAVPGYARWMVPLPMSHREHEGRVEAMTGEAEAHARLIAREYARLATEDKP